MSENLMNGINEMASSFFLDIAEESLKKENMLYKKIFLRNFSTPKELFESGKLFDIYSLMDNILKENNFLFLLRTSSFYNKIASKTQEKIEESNKKNTLINNSFDILHNTLQNTMKESLEDKQVGRSGKKNQLRSLIFQIVKENSSKKISYQEILQKVPIVEVEIDAKKTPETIQIRRRISSDNKKGLILWNKNDTDNLIKVLEKTFEIEILEKKDSYYIVQDSAAIDSEILLESFKEVISNINSKQAKDMILWINNNDIKILNIFERDPSIKDLLIGRKDMKKIKGDIGELMTRLILEIYLSENLKMGQSIFGMNMGDQDFGTGQAAVDVALGKMGFQVKNFPSSEGIENVLLYHTSNLLYDGKQIYLKNENGNRYMDKNDWYGLIYSKTWDEIRRILIKALPNYLRYSENIINQTIFENSGLKKLASLRNNFYVINFRIIPASIIFFQLAKLVKETEQKYAIDDLFYYSETQEKERNPQKIIDKEKDLNLMTTYISPRKKEGKIYFTFKGIKLFNKTVTKENFVSGNLVKF